MGWVGSTELAHRLRTQRRRHAVVPRSVWLVVHVGFFAVLGVVTLVSWWRGS